MLTYLRQDTIYEAFAKGWRVISINIRAIYVMANANIMNIATSHIFGLDDVIPRKNTDSRGTIHQISTAP